MTQSVILMPGPINPVLISPSQTRPLDQNPAAVYLATLRPTGRRTMRQALNLMAGLLSDGQADALSLPWQELGYQHTVATRARLQERYSPATANKMLAALRRVLKEAWRLGLMEAEAYRRATDLPNIRAETLQKGRALSCGELKALLRVCSEDTTAAGARDAGLLAVLYGAGLRRSEAASLEPGSYQAEGRALTIRSGKGGKDRLTYLPGWAGEALTDWLHLRGEGTGRLFLPIGKNGQIGPAGAGGGITDQAILKRSRGEKL